ncbi:hypothetical protein BGX27_001454 [Mortierella sp. AM989]|nr:hypothetical protein BGX27_001454 [Mortierella sp. AM989]
MANTLSKTRESPASDAVRSIGSNVVQSSEKGMSNSLRKSKRISSSNVRDPVPVVDGNDKIDERNQTGSNAITATLDAKPDILKEKENVPPSGNRIDESSLGDKSQERGEQAKKRRLSRPTRVIKLDVQRYRDDGEFRNIDNGGVNVDNVDLNDTSRDDRQKYPQKSEPAHINVRVTRGMPDDKQEEISEYERQRLENIKRNQEMLRFLELPTAAIGRHALSMEKDSGDKAKSVNVSPPGSPTLIKPIKIRRAYVKTTSKTVQPVRASNRLRGLAITPLEIGEDDSLDRGAPQLERNTSGFPQGDIKANDESDDENVANLMSGDLFFDQKTREKAIRVDGHYMGWLSSDIMEKYGFEKSAQEAWEANGGGAFSFKDPLGLNDEAVSSRSKSSKKPKHDAKMVAKAMFKKNPNAFFYRHNEPGQVNTG